MLGLGHLRMLFNEKTKPTPALWACHVLIGLHISRSYIGLPLFFLPLPIPKALYNTDLVQVCVQYRSGSSLCTIRSCGSCLYDIHLRATTTTILSTRGVTISIGLVSSATDSIRRLRVLFKPVPVQTSDLKSEFLCQSSLSCAEPTDPLKPPRTPGISPTPSQPCITHIVIALVLLPSIWRTSYVDNGPNILVTASPLKPSQMFHLNVTEQNPDPVWLWWQQNTGWGR